MKLIDLTGQKFGRLTVIERAPTKNKRTMWKCVCNCKDKTVCIVNGESLRSGKTKSCTCLSREKVRIRMTQKSLTHGKTHTRLYNTWHNMKQRCNNPNSKAYILYGAEGKKVCDEWQKFEPFYDWAISHGYRKDLTIERIDGTKGYSPENCRWVTQKEQCNNRRSNIKITYNGKTQSAGQWAKEYGLKATLFRQRLKKGWNIERALTEKPFKGKNRYNSKTP